MTGFMHEKEFSRKSFVKGGGALIVGVSASAGAGLAGKAGDVHAPTSAGYNPDRSDAARHVLRSTPTTR